MRNDKQLPLTDMRYKTTLVYCLYTAYENIIAVSGMHYINGKSTMILDANIAWITPTLPNALDSKIHE